MDKIKLSPKQMTAIANRISEIFSTLYSADKPLQLHYEHIIIDNEMIKIGFVPDESSNRTVMNIRIVYKGKING